MKRIKSIVLILLVVMGVSACAPEPVLRLQSMANQSTWYQGTEYIHSTADDITVTVAYIRHVDDYVVFDVEVANYSDHAVRVNPAQFSFQAFKHSGATHPMAAGYAIDPEQKLIQIDRSIAQEKANQKTMALLAVVGTGAMIVEEVTDDEEDSYHDETNEAAAMQMLAIGTAVGADQAQREVITLNSRRERWTVETLRKTDLFPDEYIRGKVFYPIAEDATVFYIKIKVGGTVHSFRFYQIKH